MFGESIQWLDLQLLGCARRRGYIENLDYGFKGVRIRIGVELRRWRALGV